MRRSPTLQGVMSVEPDNVEALCELGYIYGLRGMRDASLDAFRRAVDSHPDCAKAHKALGYYYLQEERVDEAIRECQEAVASIRATRWRTWSWPSHWEGGPPGGGRPQYGAGGQAGSRERQLLRQPHGAAPRGGSGRRGALRPAPGARYRSPCTPEVLENLAELHLERADYDQALHFRPSPAPAKKRNSLHARDILGVAYLQQGRVNEALRIADQMVHLSPLDPAHHFKKAVLFQQKGMIGSAIQEFIRVLEAGAGGRDGQ